MIALIKKLKAKGVLGLNGRNADYILPRNPRRLYPLVDDKLRTKRLAAEAGIAVPELYCVVETPHQARDLTKTLAGRTDFVVKPAHGSGGDGILVVTGRKKGGYRLADGSLLEEAALTFHVSNALSGVYSLGGQPDVVLVEYRIRFDPVFEPITHNGAPDIRIIVFMGVPVMAMARLPTRSSEGKANLHQGAIGAGIDMATGRTLRAVYKNDVVDEHPDTGNPVTGVIIPGWDRLLEMAASSFALTGLPYQGIDIVLDRDLGPLVLELNARPGLGIQIANGAGLRHRLSAVEEHLNELDSSDRRVAFAKKNFAAEDDM